MGLLVVLGVGELDVGAWVSWVRVSWMWVSWMWVSWLWVS